ncbi:MAG: hypothetical protein QOD66_1677 [Solirubrobacteraceae bacterium]|jgi:hypothetical protein|nr:hypothetical protein [Solirubrobacteraceae bacterium]
MSATLTDTPVPSSTATVSAEPARVRLRAKMLAVGWSPDDIRRVQGALTSVRLHDTYLRAGYSPDEIKQITSLY